MLRMKRLAVALSLAVAFAGAGAASAWSQERHDTDRHPVAPRGHAAPAVRPVTRGPAVHSFRGHDFAHFTPAERSAWVGGGWHHEMHNGRLGWWWVAGGLWYFYPAPVYPYPTYVADIYDEPPVAPVAPVANAQPGVWYYCSANGAYYPYTQSCPVPWTPVAPTPPQNMQ